MSKIEFLSTPSARRATTGSGELGLCGLISIHALREEGDGEASERHNRVHHFYPRPPRGGRPYFPSAPSTSIKISIHALREEGDLIAIIEHKVRNISIHALREEGDAKGGVKNDVVRNFYPRPPRGGRHNILHILVALTYFYPRPPRGGRPPEIRGQKGPHNISIHALREEGDLESGLCDGFYAIFLSTPSARRATRGQLW